jgi:hypothetical protein
MATECGLAPEDIIQIPIRRLIVYGYSTALTLTDLMLSVADYHILDGSQA